MKAKATIKSLKFNKQKYSKALHDQVAVQMRQAARAWLRAVIVKVPVYTGMARGSLIPLGQFLRVAVPINRNPSADKHGHLRTEADGIPLGNFQFRNLKRSSTFTFSTQVEHYIINELNNPNPPIHLIHEAPWHSFEAGEEAFKAYIEANLRQKIPKIRDFIINFQIKLG